MKKCIFFHQKAIGKTILYRTTQTLLNSCRWASSAGLVSGVPGSALGFASSSDLTQLLWNASRRKISEKVCPCAGPRCCWVLPARCHESFTDSSSNPLNFACRVSVDVSRATQEGLDTFNFLHRLAWKELQKYQDSTLWNMAVHVRKYRSRTMDAIYSSFSPSSRNRKHSADFRESRDVRWTFTQTIRKTLYDSLQNVRECIILDPYPQHSR